MENKIEDVSDSDASRVLFEVEYKYTHHMAYHPPTPLTTRIHNLNHIKTRMNYGISYIAYIIYIEDVR